MKTRVITGAVLVVGIIIFICFYNTFFANIVIAALALMGIWEAHHAAGLVKDNRFVTVICMLYGAVLILVPQAYRGAAAAAGLYVLVLLVFAYTLKHHKTYTVREAAYELLLGVLIPLSFSLIIVIRDRFGAGNGVFYFCLILGSAWLSDTGAYFAGTLFGKHKLCPEVSPKKTVEGLIGGIVIAVLGNLAIGKIITVLSAKGFGYLSGSVSLNWWALAGVTVVFSLIGVLGDLSFSIIKRCYGIKDYSNLLPGHGGILDRFDSVLFIIPAVYFAAVFIPLIH